MPTTSTDPRAAAAALLVPGTTCHGFAVERCETVPELDSDAYVLRHTASGARLLYLACDDENKAFAIGFKTPPADSTGVFHILEHSVLCGSAKFPVKEPFVDLIKSSMQTFLNAMTYPDKTIYPVATTNEQDLYNLMDVYLDAVFNPAIYTKPTIFEQEGWHYELDLPEGAEGEGDGSLREGTLRYNGVVFNEMKGALSDPMSVLDDAVNAALYPDTAYAHESGGDPRAIPALTYEQFLDTHARHYNPSNSYITLYGDLDVDRALAFLDERYLSQPSAASRRMDAAVAAGEDPSTLAPNPLGVQAPVTCEYKRIEMATTPENALVGLGLSRGMVNVLKKIPGVKHVQKFAMKEGILKTDSDFLGVMFKGVGPDFDSTFIHQNMIEGSIPKFDDKASHNQILISQLMAGKLKLKTGERIFAYFFDDNGVRMRRFTIKGIYQTNLKKYDEVMVYTDLYTAVKLNGWEEDQTSGAELTVNDFNKLNETEDYIINKVNRTVDHYGETYSSSTIKDLNPNIFQWLSLMDLNVWIILGLMLIVAGVTMISGLLIIILERTSMIGVMKALGARNKTIRHTFLWFAVFIIGKGMLLGNAIALGILTLQYFTGIIKLDAQTYYVSTVPVEFNWLAIIALNIATLLISIFMLVAPSYLISHIHPAKSMRYE